MRSYGFAGFSANADFGHAIDPSNGFLIEGEIKLAADIWNVRTNGLRSNRRPGALINWEGLSRETIEGRMTSAKRCGIASRTRQRTSLAFSNERIRDFMKEANIKSISSPDDYCIQRPKFRYWLCDRTCRGEIVLKACLDSFRPESVFGDIVDHDLDGLDWITVFKEKRLDAINMSLHDEWLVVFCKRYDLQQNELWYLDHVFAQETDTCDHLRSRIIHLAQVSQMAGDLYVESERSVRLVEDLNATLEEVHQNA